MVIVDTPAPKMDDKDASRVRLESTCSSGGDFDIEPLELDDLQSYDKAKNDQ